MNSLNQLLNCRRAGTLLSDMIRKRYFGPHGIGANHCNVSSPGIEPGSSQPQCEILTTVRTRPISQTVRKVRRLQFTFNFISFYHFISCTRTLHTHSHIQQIKTNASKGQTPQINISRTQKFQFHPHYAAKEIISIFICTSGREECVSRNDGRGGATVVVVSVVRFSATLLIIMLQGRQLRIR